MAEETVTITAVPVTVDPKMADDRGDNFTPTDDEVAVDNNGTSIDKPEAKISAATLKSLVDAGPKDKPAAAPAVAEATTEEDKGTKSGTIPKGRLNEVIGQRNEAQAQAAALAAEIEEWRTGKKSAAPAPAAAPAAPAFDEDAKETEHAEALMEGDIKKAVAIRKEINQHIRSETAAQTTESVTRQLTARQAQSAIEEATTQVLSAHPYLDTPDGATALTAVIAMRDHYIASQGMPAHLALKKAAAEIAPRFAPAKVDTPSSELPTATPPVDTRTADALRRGAEDSLKQPPLPTAGIGNRATQSRVNVAGLDEEQFAALTKEEKKKLRGD